MKSSVLPSLMVYAYNSSSKLQALCSCQYPSPRYPKEGGGGTPERHASHIPVFFIRCSYLGRERFRSLDGASLTCLPKALPPQRHGLCDRSHTPRSQLVLSGLSEEERLVGRFVAGRPREGVGLDSPQPLAQRIKLKDKDSIPSSTNQEASPFSH